ncbi:MAG: ROK family protein [Actinobacteria bacterium]|nr:ROK family protein [Actinomycetota bacterium]
MTVAGSVVAIDVGGTTTKAARFAADGAVLVERVVPTPVADGPDAVVTAVRALARELVEEADDVLACGLVVPGEVDSAAGVARYSANLGWRELAFRDVLAAEVGVPTVLGHDVRAGAYAERELGASHGVADSVVVPIGTGVAAVAVSGGRAIHGATALAGELGHLAVVPDGEPCPCGQRGCLERYASAAAIARHYEQRTGTPTDARTVAARIAEDPDADPDAVAAWRQATDALATALAACTVLLDPSLFVLAGGLAEAGETLATPVRDRLAELVRFRPVPPVAVSPLGGAAGRIGAALLAWDLVGGADLARWRTRWRGRIG